MKISGTEFNALLKTSLARVSLAESDFGVALDHCIMILFKVDPPPTGEEFICIPGRIAGLAADPEINVMRAGSYSMRSEAEVILANPFTSTGMEI